MKWTNLAHWLEVVDRLRTWLLGFESSFFPANTALRFIFVLIAVKIVFSLLVTAVQLTAHGVRIVLWLAAGTAARWLTLYDFIGVLATTYVRVEALVLRIMRPALQTYVLGRNNEENGGSQGVRLTIPRSLGFSRIYLLGYISIFTLGLPVAILRILFYVSRSFTRLNISNIAAIVVAFWLRSRN